MLTLMRALWHNRLPGHRIWSEEMIWSSRRAQVYFCTCGRQFWPPDAPYEDYRANPVQRTPPWEA